MSLQKKKELRLAVTILGKVVGAGSILRPAITARCRSLVLRGAGTVVGVKGMPIFTRPMAVWHHLQGMRKYSFNRCAL